MQNVRSIAGVELSAQLEEKESRMVMRRVLFLPGESDASRIMEKDMSTTGAQVRAGWSRYPDRSRFCISGKLTRAGSSE